MTTTTKAKRRNSTPTTIDDGSGYRCPRCGARCRVKHTSTIGCVTTRRRRCEGCEHRFTTTERPDADDPSLLVKALRQIRTIREDADGNMAGIEAWLREAIGNATDSGNFDR